MSRLKKRFEQFVSKLSPDEVREQLVLAYLQMERCQRVLRGEDVTPLMMRDNGRNSDMELFYLCKKLKEEQKIGRPQKDFLKDMSDADIKRFVEYVRKHKVEEKQDAAAKTEISDLPRKDKERLLMIMIDTFVYGF